MMKFRFVLTHCFKDCVISLTSMEGTSKQNIPFCCWLWGFYGSAGFHIIIFTLQKRETHAGFGFLHKCPLIGSLSVAHKSAHLLFTNVYGLKKTTGCVILHPDRLQTYHDRKSSSRGRSWAGPWDRAGGWGLTGDVQEVKLGHHGHAHPASGQSLDRRERV